MEREHEKALLALEQEIEGWKSANRILKAKLEITQKALEKVLNNGRIDWTPEEAENVIIMCGDIAEEALDQLKE